MLVHKTSVPAAGLVYKQERTLQIARETDWKVGLLEVRAFWELFVRDLYANLYFMEFCGFGAFLE